MARSASPARSLSKRRRMRRPAPRRLASSRLHSRYVPTSPAKTARNSRPLKSRTSMCAVCSRGSAVEIACHSRGVPQETREVAVIEGQGELACGVAGQGADHPRPVAVWASVNEEVEVAVAADRHVALPPLSSTEHLASSHLPSRCARKEMADLRRIARTVLVSDSYVFCHKNRRVSTGYDRIREFQLGLLRAGHGWSDAEMDDLNRVYSKPASASQAQQREPSTTGCGPPLGAPLGWATTHLEHTSIIFNRSRPRSDFLLARR